MPRKDAYEKSPIDLISTGAKVINAPKDSSNSGIYAIPMVISPVIIKNGLQRKLSNYMADVMFTVRLDMIQKKLVQPSSTIFDWLVGITSIAAAGAVAYDVYKKYKKESIDVKIGSTSIRIEPIMVRNMDEISSITPSTVKKFLAGLKRFLSPKNSSFTVVYEKHPTIIFERNEKSSYQSYLDKSNYMELDLINGNVNIHCLTDKSYTTMTTNIEDIPNQKQTIDISQLATILKGLNR